MSGSTTIARLRAVLADDTFAARYEILGEAGRGGMGTLHRATDRESRRAVAIKVLHEPAHSERFTREAELLERLSHPAIVAYLGHGVTSDGSAYLAMAWLDGEDLARRIERAALSVEDVIAVGVRVADALAYAHGLGIVHRDIKPSNVLLVDEEPSAATLLDFGIAKDTSRHESLTATGQLVGTPGYMAPEQALGASDLDARVDVFGLGALLYHALAGEPPFGGRQTIEVLARVLTTDPAPLAAVCPEVPPRLAALVMRMLAREPAARPATAKLVGDELRAIAEALARGDAGALAAPETPGDAVTRVERPQPARRRSRGPLLVGAGVVLALGAAIAVLARDDAPARPSTPVAMASGSATPEPTSDRHACVADKRCTAACEAGDAKACYAQGLLETEMPARISWFSRGCDLGEVNACLHAGNLKRRARARGDQTFTRADWVAPLERGCTLGGGSVCATLAKYLGDEQPTDVDPVIALLLRGCRAPRSNLPSCVRAAEMLDLRARPGDADEARAVRAIACTAGYTRACAK